MKFILTVLAVAIVALVGLYFYALTLEPEVRLIEQEAFLGNDA